MDLVQVTTADGLRLDGILRQPTQLDSAAPIDAWLFIHGTGSNFYSAKLLAALEPRVRNRPPCSASTPAGTTW